MGVVLKNVCRPKVKRKHHFHAIPFWAYQAFIAQGWADHLWYSESRPTTVNYKHQEQLHLCRDKLSRFLNLDVGGRTAGQGGAGRVLRHQGGSEALVVVMRAEISFIRKGRSLDELTTRCTIEYDYVLVSTYGDVLMDTRWMRLKKMWKVYFVPEDGDDDVPDEEHLEILENSIELSALQHVRDLSVDDEFKHIVERINFHADDI